MMNDVDDVHRKRARATSEDPETAEDVQNRKRPALTTSNGETTTLAEVEEYAEDAAQEQDNGGDTKQVDHKNINNTIEESESKPEESSGDTSMEAAEFDEGDSAKVSSDTTVSSDVSTMTLRAIIVTKEASIIIGKAGANVNEIRERSGARVTISEHIKGTVERILSVSGTLDSIAKAFGLIVRTIQEEPLDKTSSSDSPSMSIRLIVPHVRMGSVIGKGGAKIKEIQESSGARLNASEQMLPQSTERILTIHGVADSVHIAIYHIAKVFNDHTDRLQSTIPYRPLAMYGHPPPDTYYGGSRGRFQRGLSPLSPPGAGATAMGAHYGPPHNAYYAPSYPQPLVPVVMPPYPSHASPRAGNPPVVGGSTSQQIFIPNAMVGCIIGKGGSKINEIRQMSGSHIKIQEPMGDTNERLVTITGTPESNHMALYLLHTRLDAETRRM